MLQRCHIRGQMDARAVGTNPGDGVIVAPLHGTQLAGVPLDLKSIAGGAIAVHVEAVKLNFLANVFLDDGSNVATIAPSPDGAAGCELRLAMVANLGDGRVALVTKEVRGTERILQIRFAAHGDVLDEGIQNVHNLRIDLYLTIGSKLDTLLGAEHQRDEQKATHLEVVVVVVVVSM